MSKARNLADVIVDVGGDINSASLDNVTPASVSDKTNTSTGAFDLPAGTTAQRPASPHNGQTRFNTTTGTPEYYDSAKLLWVPLGSAGADYSVEYLVVAGGGSGGDGGAGASGGGGGAGGYRTGSLSITGSTAYSIVIGAGGGVVANGSNSSFSTITSTGGGYGGTYGSGISGGSGGGASGANNSFGSGTSGQGNNGGSGTGTVGATSTGGGGGGGAGAVGGNSPNTATGGTGGSGVANSISGSSVTYAVGGGGGSTSGAGSRNATVNTGNGGGGASSSGTGATAGQSGVVIIRYAGAQRATGGTVTSSGGNTIHTFTSSGTFTA